MGEILDLKKNLNDVFTNNIQIFCNAEKGNIPVIGVNGKSLAEAWENSLLALYGFGCKIRTQYDETDKEGNFIDPPSRDSTLTFIVKEAWSDPMIHKCFPGGLEDLEEYRQEVIEGVKNDWIRDKRNPDDTRWEYTYNERLFNYKVPGLNRTINQIEAMIKGLAKSPYSRRLQAITWQPWEDLNIGDPACLQSIWARMLKDEEGTYRLSMNVRFRSRDAYKAAFMNAFAFIHLQKYIAEGISEIIGEEVKLGRYVDSSDSYHIYGKDLERFRNEFIGGFVNRKFEDRTWPLDFAKPIFEEAKPKIAKKIADQTKKYELEYGNIEESYEGRNEPPELL